jgi:hypothetical protein
VRLTQRVKPAVCRIDFVVELELAILPDFAQGIVFVQVNRAAAARRLVIS